jgi:hypothetical protein
VKSPPPALPRFVHVLTTIHALGAVACFAMGAGSALSAEFRTSLAVSGGSRLMLALFGEWTWAFLLFVGTVLGVLAWASWRCRPWAWEMTLVVYGIGVVGSFWQVTMGIPQGWLAAIVNGAVVIYAARPSVRQAYRGG